MKRLVIPCLVVLLWAFVCSHAIVAQTMAQTGGSPVEVRTLTAVYGSNGVELNWTVAGVSDNARFIISRSASDTGDFTTISSFISDAAINTHDNDAGVVSYRFTDGEPLIFGETYRYRVQYAPLNGSHSNASRNVALTLPQLSDMHNTSEDITLGRNIPDPVHSLTRIPFSVKWDAMATLIVYDERGRETARRSIHATPGMNTVDIDVTGASAGNYLYQLQVDGTILTRTMMVVR